MAFARPKPDATSDGIRQRYTELSDVIRARNKREDRLLNVRIKYYEHEKNIRLNIIHKDQRQLERVRKSLFEDEKKIQLKTQNSSLPLWMSPRLQSQDKILRQNSSLPLWMSPRLQSQDKILTPEFIFTDWNLDSNLIQSEIMSSNINNNMLNTTDVIRRHSAR